MNDNPKPSFEMSIDTRAVYDRLKEAAIGELISFSSLSELLGRSVKGSTSNLQTALRRLEGEGWAFANVPKSGYRRLNDIEIVQTSEQARESMRRKANRVVKKLTCVQDFERLPNDMKVKHNAAVSGFGAIAAMMSPSKMKVLEASVEKAQQQLPLAKTLEAFRV